MLARDVASRQDSSASVENARHDAATGKETHRTAVTRETIDRVPGMLLIICSAGQAALSKELRTDR
jgi:hypothetical protein